MGRVACVKFDNILDALALNARQLKLILPLNNGTIDEPIIIPSFRIKKFIEEFEIDKAQFKITTAGYAFRKLNNEIAQINEKIETFDENELKQSKDRDSDSKSKSSSRSSSRGRGGGGGRFNNRKNYQDNRNFRGGKGGGGGGGRRDKTRNFNRGRNNLRDDYSRKKIKKH